VLLIVFHLSQPSYIVCVCVCVCVCVQWAYIHSDSTDLCSLKQVVVQRSLMPRISIYDHICFVASDAVCVCVYMCVFCVCVRMCVCVCVTLLSKA
jgi:hypothetical protein